MANRELLAQLVEELALLRRAVERAADRLEAAPQGAATRREKTPLAAAECRALYQEILAEYKETRTTRKLDALLARSRRDLSLFCSVNNLPIELRSGKTVIRDQILARIREDEQLSASYPMARQEPAYLAERKKNATG